MGDQDLDREYGRVHAALATMCSAFNITISLRDGYVHIQIAERYRRGKLMCMVGILRALEGLDLRRCVIGVTSPSPFTSTSLIFLARAVIAAHDDAIEDALLTLASSFDNLEVSSTLEFRGYSDESTESL